MIPKIAVLPSQDGPVRPIVNVTCRLDGTVLNVYFEDGTTIPGTALFGGGPQLVVECDQMAAIRAKIRSLSWQLTDMAATDGWREAVKASAMVEELSRLLHNLAI